MFIGVLAIDAGGVSVAYRKMWLGEEEAKRFTPGPEPAKLTVDGWRLGLAVCKDTGVAQHARTPRRWVSTPIWPARSWLPTRLSFSTNGAGASPPAIICGSR